MSSISTFKIYTNTIFVRYTSSPLHRLYIFQNKKRIQKSIHRKTNFYPKICGLFFKCRHSFVSTNLPKIFFHTEKLSRSTFALFLSIFYLVLLLLSFSRNTFLVLLKSQTLNEQKINLLFFTRAKWLIDKIKPEPFVSHNLQSHLSLSSVYITIQRWHFPQ